jgi:hypothetical protein
LESEYFNRRKEVMNLAHGRAAAAIILGGTLLGGCVLPESPPANEQAVAIEDVISQVQKALENVQSSLSAKNFPPLKEVKLTLQTVATRKGGGALKLWVVSLGAAVEKTRTQQIVLTLVPPPAGHPRLTTELSLTADLEAAILSAADGVQKAREASVPLVTSALDVEINFTVKGSLTGGANLPSAPLVLGLSGEASGSSVQTIKVSFAAK